MPRRKHDGAPGDVPADPAAEDPSPHYDSTFEEAQRLLQAAIAEVREPGSSEHSTTLPGGFDEPGEHRRWRRRVHGDTGEHAAITNGQTDTTGPVADAEPVGVVEPPPEVLDPPPAPEVDDDVTPEVLEARRFEAIAVDEEAGRTAEMTVGAPDPDAEPPIAMEPAATAVPVTAPDPAGATDEQGATAEVAGHHRDGPLAADGTTEAGADPGSTGRRRRPRSAAATAGAATTIGAADEPGADVAGIGGTDERRSARRRRERGPGQPATIGAPTAEYVLAVDESPTDDELAPAASGSQRTRRVLVASLAAVVAIAAIAAIALALVSGGSDDEVASPPSNVQPRLEFDPVTTPEGATVTRVWTLSGDDGDQLDGSLKFENTTANPVTTTFTEVIPKSMASSVSVITFDPQPVVVKSDPVVQWTATIDPGGSFVASYEIPVTPSGATRQRLLAWQDDLEAELGTTTTTTLPPVTTTEAPTTTVPQNTAPSPTTPVTVPATTVAPPTTTAPPANASIVIFVYNVGEAEATFNFSNGISLTALPQQQSSRLVTVPPGVHSVTLLNGTTTDITCSGRGSGSGSTATYDVGPGEQAGCTWSASVATP